MVNNNPPKMTKSVARATEVIRALSEGICTIVDISKRLDLNQSTVFRILNTLKEMGFVAQNETTREYYIGYSISRLAFSNINIHRCLIASVHSEMKYLWEQTKETVSLHIQSGMHAMLIEQILSEYDLRFSEKKFESSLRYAGSIGMTLLSQLEDNILEILIKHLNIATFTKHTITDKTLLLEKIQKIKKQGYAISFGEVVEGTVAISVPVKNYPCPVALSVVGPENRLSRYVTELTPTMLEISGKASQNVLEDCRQR